MKLPETKLQSIFVKHGVVAAYAFGSQIEGHSDPMSDLDLGVLYGRQEKSVNKILSLQADLQAVCSPIPLDLIVLDKARNNVAFNAITNGSLIFSSDENLRRNFEENVLRIYHDFAPFMAKFYRDVETSILSGDPGD